MLISLLLVEGLDPGVVRREELEIHVWEKSIAQMNCVI